MKYNLVKTIFGQTFGQTIASYPDLEMAKEALAQQWEWLLDRGAELSPVEGLDDDGMTLRYDNYQIEILPADED